MKYILLILLLIPLRLFAPNAYYYTERMEEKYVPDNKFRDMLGMLESSGNYYSINKIGALGKYQFTRVVFKHFGIEGLYDTFRRNIEMFTPYEQEMMMTMLINENKKLLSSEYSFIGHRVHGVLITEAGLIAAAHLGGSGSVKAFLYKRKNPTDINSKSIKERLFEFSGFTGQVK